MACGETFYGNPIVAVADKVVAINESEESREKCAVIVGLLVALVVHCTNHNIDPQFHAAASPGDRKAGYHAGGL